MSVCLHFLISVSLFRAVFCLCLSMSLYAIAVCLSLALSVFLSVSLCLSLSVSFSVCLSLSLSLSSRSHSHCSQFSRLGSISHKQRNIHRLWAVEVSNAWLGVMTSICYRGQFCLIIVSMAATLAQSGCSLFSFSLSCPALLRCSHQRNNFTWHLAYKRVYAWLKLHYIV